MLHTADIVFDRVDLRLEREYLIFGRHFFADIGDVTGDCGKTFFYDARERVNLLLECSFFYHVEIIDRVLFFANMCIVSFWI